MRSFLEHPEHFNLLTVYEIRLHRKAQAELKQLREIQTQRRREEAARREQEAAGRQQESESRGKEIRNEKQPPQPGPVPPSQPESPLIMQTTESEPATPANGFDFSALQFSPFLQENPPEPPVSAPLGTDN